MGRQAQIFLSGEGAAWLERNKDKLPPEYDPVQPTIDAIAPEREWQVLEIGCANGWRLRQIHQKHGCQAYGIDPGIGMPVVDNDINIYPGVADSLNYKSHTFNIVIYGFCLYLCDPEDYFNIAAEGDRVLKPGGYMVIYDFYAPYTPHANDYKHRDGIKSYKRDFSSLWTWHPNYKEIDLRIHGDTIADQTAVICLRKLA